MSNTASFVLRPTIAKKPDVEGGNIKVEVTPSVGADQTVRLLLSLIGSCAPAGGSSGGYVLEEPSEKQRTDNGNTTSVTFPTRDFPCCTYAVRIQVDGVESPSTGSATVKL
jgi:hypothetical protein